MAAETRNGWIKLFHASQYLLNEYAMEFESQPRCRSYPNGNLDTPHSEAYTILRKLRTTFKHDEILPRSRRIKSKRRT